MTETILVVDDQSSVRTLLKDYLTSQGYRVVTANDGQDALFVARHEQPNLVLLDIMMPKMDGFEVLAKLKELDLLKKVKVIVATNLSQDVDMEKVREAGAIDYFVKSDLSISEMVQKVREKTAK